MCARNIYFEYTLNIYVKKYIYTYAHVYINLIHIHTYIISLTKQVGLTKSGHYNPMSQIRSEF